MKAALALITISTLTLLPGPHLALALDTSLDANQYAHTNKGHNGACWMRERATLIKGKLVVWSEVDAGTEVELRVPASAAYMTDRKPSWWLLKFARKSEGIKS